MHRREARGYQRCRLLASIIVLEVADLLSSEPAAVGSMVLNMTRAPPMTCTRLAESVKSDFERGGEKTNEVIGELGADVVCYERDGRDR